MKYYFNIRCLQKKTNKKQKQKTLISTKYRNVIGGKMQLEASVI
jgi:hypothetical protein